ncbi:MAG: PorV/PorQ family protein, partial [Rhodothermales bacterium]
MTEHKRYIGVMLAVLLGFATLDAHAQSNERFGTSSLTELTVPVTPRSVALGSAMTGGMNGASGVEALIVNPAAVMLNQGTGAMFSRMNYIADVGVNYFGVAQRFGSNNVSLTVTNWDYGDIPETTTDDPEIVETRTWSAGTIIAGLTYGRQLTDRIAAGVTLKGMTQSIDNMDARTFAVDAGMTYVVGESGLRFGVSLRNFGPQVGYDGIGLQDPISSSGPAGEFDV